jgi:hypothetical protein
VAEVDDISVSQYGALFVPDVTRDAMIRGKEEIGRQVMRYAGVNKPGSGRGR